MAQARLVRGSELLVEAPADLPARMRELADLRWRDLSAEEAAVCTPLVVLLSTDALGGAAAAGLSRLLSSKLPLRVVVLDDRDLLARRVDPALAALAHRETFVLSTSVAHPDHLFRGTIAALKPLGYEVINLGGDRPTQLSALIEQIARLLDRKPQIEYQPAHPADVPATWAEIGKARRLLDWSPQVSLEEGLRRSVAWFRENRKVALSLQLGDRED